jgi:hypothetical protein
MLHTCSAPTGRVGVAILMPSTPYHLDEIQAFADEVISAVKSRR